MPWRPRTHAERLRARTREAAPQKKGDPFYWSTRWRKLRAMVLADEPMCADPFGLHAKFGDVVPATEVHHLEPRSKRPDLELVRANLESLCKSCHSKISRKERHGADH